MKTLTSGPALVRFEIESRTESSWSTGEKEVKMMPTILQNIIHRAIIASFVPAVACHASCQWRGCVDVYLGWLGSNRQESREVGGAHALEPHLFPSSLVE
jgi:hypothetical protein